MSEDLASVTVDRRAGGQTVVAVAGEIDMSNVDEVQRAIDAAVPGAATLVIDLSTLDYLDSQGLRMLYQVVSGRAAATVCVVAPEGTVAAQLLTIAGMREVIPVVEQVPSPGAPPLAAS